MYLAPNHFLQTLLALKERKPALSLLCSLINTALSKPPPSSFSSPTEAFNKLQVVTTGHRETEEQASALPHACFALLDVLLVSHDFSSSEAPLSPTGPSGFLSPTQERADMSFSSVMDSSRPDNIFKYYSSKLHQPADYKFLLDGVLGLLNAASNGTTSFMPAVPVSIPGLAGMVSSKGGDDVAEVVVFLWKMTEVNKVGCLHLVNLTDSRADPTGLSLFFGGA
jgi:hypothetical protein